MDAEEARQAPATVGRDPELKKLEVLLSKMMLRNSQDMRDTLAVIMDNFIGPNEADIVGAAKAPGEAYSKGTERRSWARSATRLDLRGGR